MQDPDKFIEQADQEQQELRRKLEDATERVKTIQVRPANSLLSVSLTKLLKKEHLTLPAGHRKIHLFQARQCPVQAGIEC